MLFGLNSSSLSSSGNSGITISLGGCSLNDTLFITATGGATVFDLFFLPKRSEAPFSKNLEVNDRLCLIWLGGEGVSEGSFGNGLLTGRVSGADFGFGVDSRLGVVFEFVVGAALGFGASIGLGDLGFGLDI